MFKSWLSNECTDSDVCVCFLITARYFRRRRRHSGSVRIEAGVQSQTVLLPRRARPVTEQRVHLVEDQEHLAVAGLLKRFGDPLLAFADPALRVDRLDIPRAATPALPDRRRRA